MRPRVSSNARVRSHPNAPAMRYRGDRSHSVSLQSWHSLRKSLTMIASPSNTSTAFSASTRARLNFLLILVPRFRGFAHRTMRGDFAPVGAYQNEHTPAPIDPG